MGSDEENPCRYAEAPAAGALYSISHSTVGRFFGAPEEEGRAPRVSVAGSHRQAYQGVFTASLGALPSSLGAVLYPQAMQRLFAARSERNLRLSLAIMAFLPFTTVLIAVIAGIYALAYIPGLEGAASDQILSHLLAEMQQHSAFGYW
jgi:Na+/proline symporter